MTEQQQALVNEAAGVLAAAYGQETKGEPAHGPLLVEISTALLHGCLVVHQPEHGAFADLGPLKAAAKVQKCCNHPAAYGPWAQARLGLKYPGALESFPDDFDLGRAIAAILKAGAAAEPAKLQAFIEAVKGESPFVEQP